MFCFMFLDGIYLLNGDDVAGYVGPLQIYLLEDYYLSVLDYHHHPVLCVLQTDHPHWEVLAGLESHHLINLKILSSLPLPQSMPFLFALHHKRRHSLYDIQNRHLRPPIFIYQLHVIMIGVNA